jgi:molybdate transport system permease protein
MTAEAWSPIGLSLKCGLLSGLINVPWGLGMGWLLARREFPGKVLLQTFLFLPLVLPPVLTGYLLLIILSPAAPAGHFLERYFSLRFVLDWKGCVAASAVVSSPFMIQMVRQSLEQMDLRLEWIARGLGAGRLKTFFTITLPLCRPGLVAGFFLVFARSVGEFGATVILAGNMPGRTQTIPLAIYNKVMLGQEAGVVPFALAAIVLSYLGLGLSSWALKGNRRGGEAPA